MLLKNRKYRIDPRDLDLEERTVYIGRVSKVVKGGKRFKFTAWVVVGDRHGHVGIGHGTAQEVPEAVRKAKENARKNIIKIPMYGNTIPHGITYKFGASKVMLKPASPGTGIIACDPVRAVIELGGIRDILTKSLGSNNTVNLVKATFFGLMNIRTPDEYAKMRGKDIKEILKGRRRYRASENVEA